MGWKCPTCRRHVYKSGKCPYCGQDYCELCQSTYDPSQINEHHIEYDPEITIFVCDGCHEKIHFPGERSTADPGELLDRLNPLAADGGDSLD